VALYSVVMPSPITCCRLLAICLVLRAASPLAAADSTSQNPSWVFPTPGTRTVTLETCNRYGLCSSVQRTIVVLDPLPAIVSAAPATASAEIGQLVRLDASGTGRPTLNYAWTISLAGIPVGSANGATAYWNTAGLLPGSYEVTLRLSNTDGFDDALAMPVSLLANANTEFHTITPCRLLDSRVTGGPLLAGETRLLPSSFTTCGIPRAARALAANVTAIGATAPGEAKIYPGNYPPPIESVVAFAAGQSRANNQVLSVSTDGVATLRAMADLPPGASVHLIVDVSGYFLPPDP
jgi:PKD repeat protein